MGWILLFITILSFIAAVVLLRYKPNLSMGISIVVPFVCFYVIGKLGLDEVFIMFAIVYSIFTNWYVIRNHSNLTSA